MPTSDCSASMRIVRYGVASEATRGARSASHPAHWRLGGAASLCARTGAFVFSAAAPLLRLARLARVAAFGEHAELEERLVALGDDRFQIAARVLELAGRARRLRAQQPRQRARPAPEATGTRPRASRRAPSLAALLRSRNALPFPSVPTTFSSPQTQSHS